jgi:hypothetical protein
VYSCKKCGELNYLTPHAFWNITDFGAKCERCETINTMALEKGELKNKCRFITESLIASAIIFVGITLTLLFLTS